VSYSRRLLLDLWAGIRGVPVSLSRGVTKAMSSIIRQRPDFHTLTSSEVLDEFIAMNIMNKTANNALARVRSNKSTPSLALKAKAIPEEEEDEEEEECGPGDTKYAYN